MQRNLATKLGLAVALVLNVCVWPLAGAEPTAEQTAAMQGTWQIESFLFDGNMFGPDQIEDWRRVVENNHVIWKDGEKTILETDIKFDPTQQPLTLDCSIASGDNRGKVLLAIYELNGDELRVCFGHPDRPRPTEFKSVGGSGQSMFTAKRVKP